MIKNVVQINCSSFQQNRSLATIDVPLIFHDVIRYYNVILITVVKDGILGLAPSLVAFPLPV